MKNPRLCRGFIITIWSSWLYTQAFCFKTLHHGVTGERCNWFFHWYDKTCPLLSSPTPSFNRCFASTFKKWNVLSKEIKRFYMRSSNRSARGAYHSSIKFFIPQKIPLYKSKTEWNALNRSNLGAVDMWKNGFPSSFERSYRNGWGHWILQFQRFCWLADLCSEQDCIRFVFYNQWSGRWTSYLSRIVWACPCGAGNSRTYLLETPRWGKRSSVWCSEVCLMILCDLVQQGCCLTCTYGRALKKGQEDTRGW